MDGDLLCLKWRDHCSSIVRTLSSVRRKEVYCDATIACNGKFYPVHKFVLSTCSDYFEQILSLGEQKNLIIVITDIGCEELETLLDYMYFGQVNVLQSDLNRFMKAADRLRIKGLAEPSEADQKDHRADKRSRIEHEMYQEAKRKRGIDEDTLLSESSYSLGSNNDNIRNKDRLEARKDSSVTPVEVSKDISSSNNISVAKDNIPEVKMESLSMKVEAEEWPPIEGNDDTAFFMSSHQSFLPPASALSINPAKLSGNTQPTPSTSGLQLTQSWEQGGAAMTLSSDDFSSYKGESGKRLSFSKKTGRPSSDIWNHYQNENRNGKTYVVCIYCAKQKYGYPNATKMKLHTAKCPLSPDEVKIYYNKELAQMLAKSEANKSIFLKQNPNFETPGLQEDHQNKQ